MKNHKALFSKIIEANIKKAQQMSEDQKQQQAQQNQTPQNEPPKPPTVEAPKAPVAPKVEAPKAPVAPTATNPNPSPQPVVNQPDQNTVNTINKKLEDANPNNALKNASFTAAIMNVFNNHSSKRIKSFNHFNKVKNIILSKTKNEYCVVKFAGSEDYFPMKINESNYDKLNNNGMSDIFNIVSDKTNSFNVSITTKKDNDNVFLYMKQIAEGMKQIGFDCLIYVKDRHNFIMKFNSSKEIDIHNIMGTFIELIKTIAVEETQFDLSDLNQGNMKNISEHETNYRVLEL